jgi:hypothetical protein
VFVAACILLFQPAAALAGAPPPSEPSVPPTDVGDPPSTETTAARSPTILLEGYRAEYTHQFVIPGGRRPGDDGSATVTFRLPDLVVDVAVSAELNGAPIGSWLLGDGPSIAPIEITLPVDALTVGTNELLLETVIPLSIDATCPLSGHPARWIELLGPITPDVPTVAGPPAVLSDFPAVMSSDTGTTTIVVGHIDGAHLTAAAAVGAAITQSLGRDHVIAVATPGMETTGTTVSLLVTGGRGGISIGADTNGLPTTAITARDGTELATLALAYAQPGTRARLVGSSVDAATVLNLASTETATPVREAGEDWLAGITLDELGYGPTSLEGPGVDRANYSFDLPLGDIYSFMTMTIDAAASAGGPGWTPAIDVYINGRLAGNGVLGDQYESFEVDVPNQLLRPGTNFVRLEVDPGASASCGVTPPPTYRIDIMGSTTFRLRHGSPIEPDLDDLPYLLRSSRDTASTTIITPSEPSIDEAGRVVRLAILLGGRGRAPTVMTAAEDTASPTAATHLVLVGTPDRQPRLSEIARDLPLGGAVPDRWAADIEHQLGGVRHGASIQLARTAEDGLLLAVIADRDGDAIAAVDALLDEELRGRLVGTMALTSAAPLGVVSVRYEGDPVPPTSDQPSTIDPADATADTARSEAASFDGGTDGTDRAPTRPWAELITIGAGIAVLGAVVILMRRFGMTRAADSAGVG